jgi:hypothetical protein
MSKPKIPKKGTWILIVNSVPVMNAFAPRLSVWYAVPTGEISIGTERLAGFYGHDDIMDETWFDHFRQMKSAVNLYLSSNKRALSEQETKDVETVINNRDIHQQVSILTPFGSVILQPEEYTVIDIKKYFHGLESGSHQLKLMTSNKGASSKWKEQIDYIRSRGIKLEQALEWVSGSVNSQNSFYLLAHPSLQEMFDRDFEAQAAKLSKFKEETLKRHPQHEAYFFDEEDAWKRNIKFHENGGE